MSYINAKIIENIFTMIIDMMRDVDKQLNKTGTDKKKIVLGKLEDIFGDDFSTYKPVFESIIDGIIILARNKKILSDFTKIKYCCI